MGEEQETGLAVRLGTHRVGALRDVTVALDMAAHGMLGEVQVASAALGGVPADYRAEARLEVGDENMTRGWVTKAVIRAEEVALEIRNSMPLTETLIGHLSIAGMPGDEMAWTMSHWMGLTPMVPGLRPLPETIAVAMPVTGLDITDEIDLDPIRITGDRALIEIMAAPLNPSPEKDTFLAAGVWALARVEALVLKVAEDAAVPLIESAIDRLALEAQYSLAADPAGTALAFVRAGLLTDPTAVRSALVHGHRSGRTWMRSLDNPPVRVPASGRRLTLPAMPDDPSWADALRAWRRATRETDRLAAVGALFEAIEFYASRTTAPEILGKADLRKVRKAVDALTLAVAQRQRLADLLARANEPPLRIRVTAALEADRVPYSASEIERLWDLREHRNRALHGGRRGDPSADDLDLALGFINRILVFRAWRLHSAESSANTESHLST